MLAYAVNVVPSSIVKSPFTFNTIIFFAYSDAVATSSSVPNVVSAFIFKSSLNEYTFKLYVSSSTVTLYVPVLISLFSKAFNKLSELYELFCELVSTSYFFVTFTTFWVVWFSIFAFIVIVLSSFIKLFFVKS